MRLGLHCKDALPLLRIVERDLHSCDSAITYRIVTVPVLAGCSRGGAQHGTFEHKQARVLQRISEEGGQGGRQRCQGAPSEAQAHGPQSTERAIHAALSDSRGAVDGRYIMERGARLCGQRSHRGVVEQRGKDYDSLLAP